VPGQPGKREFRGAHPQGQYLTVGERGKKKARSHRKGSGEPSSKKKKAKDRIEDRVMPL